jgi:hypothetical protein
MAITGDIDQAEAWFPRGAIYRGIVILRLKLFWNPGFNLG